MGPVVLDAATWVWVAMMSAKAMSKVLEFIALLRSFCISLDTWFHDSIGGNDLLIPKCTFFGRSFEGLIIYPDESKAFGVAICPFEVIE